MMRSIARICVALCLAAPALGSAASFDCAKAATKVEKLVCADPSVPPLPEPLGRRRRSPPSYHPNAP